MDIFAKPAEIVKKPLFACIMAESRTGKSSLFGTYSDKKVALITATGEGHGLENALKMNEVMVRNGKGKPSIFVEINLSRAQEIDFQTGYLKEGGKHKAGELLPTMAQESKLDFYLKFLEKNPPDVVGFDGLTALYEVLKASKYAQDNCYSKDGKWNDFASYSIIGSMMDEVVAKLEQINFRGSQVICTSLAKLSQFKETEDGIIPQNFSPDLPSVNISRTVLAKFSTTLLLYRHPSIHDNTPVFHFGINGVKTSKAREDRSKGVKAGEIANNLNINLRVQYLYPTERVEMLPADLENFEKNCRALVTQGNS